MPRPAATIFGIALVAFSIGFNMWRYPIAWQLAAPAAAPAVAVESPHRPAANPSPKPAEPPRADAARAMQTEAKPVTEAATKATDDSPRLGMIAPIAASAVAERHWPASANLERPMVPISKMAATGTVPIFVSAKMGLSPSTPGVAAAVRRLPPVDPYVPSPAAGYASASANGAIPIYPSTGIE